MDKTMADQLSTSPMLIHIITPSADYNWWLKSINSQLKEPTNQNLSQQIRKRYSYSLWTSIINSPVSPPSLPNLSPKQEPITNSIFGLRL